jgi:hypothetical protein
MNTFVISRGIVGMTVKYGETWRYVARTGDVN